MRERGKVYVVSVGSGGSDFMTVRGRALLGSAALVAYDSNVPRDVFRFVSQDADCVSSAVDPKRNVKKGLVTRILESAGAGGDVVRLVSGRAYLSERIFEELRRVGDGGIDFEIVPGMDEVWSALANAGIGLSCSARGGGMLIFDLGKEAAGEGLVARAIEARRAGGLVFTGVNDAVGLCDKLVEGGLAPDLPVVLIENPGANTQVTSALRLGSAASESKLQRSSGGELLLIGEEWDVSGRLDWFERRPLYGKRVVVTRAREKSEVMSASLRALGAEVLEIPVIKITPLSDSEALNEALDGLNVYDWLLFTSVNGVDTFFRAFFRRFDDLRDLGGAHLAAVGTATADRLRSIHLHVDCVPKEHTGVGLAEAMSEHSSIENLKVLMPRAEKGNKELPRILEDKGAIVDDIPCYRNELDASAGSEDAQELISGGADWITFTSGSTVMNFHDTFDLRRLREKFHGLRLASIGPETGRALESLGLGSDVVAEPHTVSSLVSAISDFGRKEGNS
ncbi:MAG: uroporphyrinogen-III synthase [Verrucomicrobia bacterium]|nr:uroporphyrinogen-III synthase [Verrucomicrobiota bacterium]MCF7708283.1 uroporphyrinogen-III synthase [Verrucomicrobiota bacterium]